MNENNNTNTIFFTIEKTFNQTTFASEKYNFMVPDTEQKAGTNGKCQWYYNFPVANLDFTQPEMVELDWLSWNTGSNTVKNWEYLLLKVRHALYSGFINRAKEQSNIFYCRLKPLPAKKEFNF